MRCYVADTDGGMWRIEEGCGCLECVFCKPVSLGGRLVPVRPWLPTNKMFYTPCMVQGNGMHVMYAEQPHMVAWWLRMYLAVTQYDASREHSCFWVLIQGRGFMILYFVFLK